MTRYIDRLSDFRKNYYHILSKEFPEFLDDYINTKEMLRLEGVNQICGSYWRKKNIFNNKYSVLDHSIAVALIIWNFTHDKIQTLAGLFHDISSPAFKHCLDFMNGDAETQETLEDDTIDVIRNSKEIMSLLNRDGITLEEVVNYKIYPIADNETPKLSADRLEYTFMNGIYLKEVWNLDIIARIYNDIDVFKDEKGMLELGFKTISIAEQFVFGAKELWPIWIGSEDIVTIYFFGDMLKRLFQDNIIELNDLYKLSEQEIMRLFATSKNKKVAEDYTNLMTKAVFRDSDIFVLDQFCVSKKTKKRYINPLTKKGRLKDVSNKAKKYITEFLDNKVSSYAYLDI